MTRCFVWSTCLGHVFDTNAKKNTSLQNWMQKKRMKNPIIFGNIPYSSSVRWIYIFRAHPMWANPFIVFISQRKSPSDWQRLSIKEARNLIEMFPSRKHSDKVIHAKEYVIIQLGQKEAKIRLKKSFQKNLYERILDSLIK